MPHFVWGVRNAFSPLRLNLTPVPPILCSEAIVPAGVKSGGGEVSKGPKHWDAHGEQVALQRLAIACDPERTVDHKARNQACSIEGLFGGIHVTASRAEVHENPIPEFLSVRHLRRRPALL